MVVALGPGERAGYSARSLRVHGLATAAEDFAGEFAFRPLLERILRCCTELLGCGAARVQSVKVPPMLAGSDSKVAHLGRGPARSVGSSRE